MLQPTASPCGTTRHCTDCPVRKIRGGGVNALIHPNDRVGSVANYVGRWINGRGEAGPFSQPVGMVLAIPGQPSLSEAA